jgi:hypothetical protein
MATTVTTTIEKRFIAPALPQPEVEHKVEYFQQFNNVLRLYFNQLDNLLGQITSTINDTSLLTFPHGAFHQDGVTTLTTAIPNGVSTSDIVVGSTASFPATGWFLIESEIIAYTGKTSTTFTGITRSTLGTSGAGHAVGSAISEVQGTGSSTTIGTVNLNNTDYSNGVSVNPSNQGQILFAKAGIYNLQISVQLLNFTSSEDNITLWFSLNGSDLANTASIEQVNSKHGSAPGARILALNILQQVDAGDYITIKWASDTGNTVIATFPAGTSPVHPVSPALIFTATFVSAP